MKRAIITGPTGVVGTALIRELHENGVELLLLVRGDSPNGERLRRLTEGMEGVSILACSLEQQKELKNETGKRYDVFYHLGWMGPKGPDRFNPYIHTRNVEYALDAVELARAFGCSCFVGAGSQAEYGRSSRILTPQSAAFPENAYGAGKLAAGHMTRLKAGELGLRHVWTRIFSVYGPFDGERTLITGMVRSLLAGERPGTTAGEQLWDYLYSEDAARALRLLGEKGLDGSTYLLAGGTSRPLREYMEELRDEVAPGAAIGFGELPYGDRQVMHLEADISMTTRDTGWRPEVSFREGIRRMLKEEFCEYERR